MQPIAFYFVLSSMALMLTAPSAADAEPALREPLIVFPPSQITGANEKISSQLSNEERTDAPLPIAGGTLKGKLNLPAIATTGPARMTHYYSGQKVQTSLAFDVTAVDSNQAEQTGLFRMNSTVGGSATTSAYKMALGAESTCGFGSSDCWGMTTVLTTTSGYSKSKNQIVHEFDQNNNSGSNCQDADIGSGGSICGTVLITGAGQNQINFALGVAGYSKVRNGLAFFSGGPIATSIRDWSSSISVLYDTGTHSNGLVLNGKYSNVAITSPGFKVSGTGILSAAEIKTDGQITAQYQKLTPVSYSTLVEQRPCTRENQGNLAFVTDSKTAVFNDPVAGGGTNAMAVVCNGTAYVVH